MHNVIKTCVGIFEDACLNVLSPCADGERLHPDQRLRRRLRPAQPERSSAPYCPDARPRDFAQPPRPPSQQLLPLTS